MKKTWVTVLALVCGLLLLVSACRKAERKEAGQAAADAARAAGDAASDAAKEAGEAVQEGAEAAKEVAQDAAKQV